MQWLLCMRLTDNLVAADVMSVALVTVKPSETIARAQLKMKYSAIHHLIVLDDVGRLVGIVSDRDLWRRFASTSRKRIRVSEVMTRRVHRVTSDTPLGEVIQKMMSKQFHSLVVVDRNRRVEGIITDRDLLRLLTSAALPLVVSGPAVPAIR